MFAGEEPGFREGVVAWLRARMLVTPLFSRDDQAQVVETFDGPTLQHALKELHGATLAQLPTSLLERPDLSMALVACSSDGACPGDGSSPAATSPAVSGGSVAQAASQATNPCTVMPVDLVRQHIPDAADPVQGPEPTHCSMSNGVSVVEIVISGGFGQPDPLDPGEAVGDLGQAEQRDDAIPMSEDLLWTPTTACSRRPAEWSPAVVGSKAARQ